MKYIILIIVLIILDQFIKFKIKKDLDKKVYFLKFNYVTNKGAALGLFKKRPKFLKAFTTLVLLLLVAIFIYCYNISKYSYTLLPFALILSGGTSNLMDRFRKGYVIDFVSVRKIYFNIADLYVLLGAIMIIIYEIKMF